MTDRQADPTPITEGTGEVVGEVIDRLLQLPTITKMKQDQQPIALGEDQKPPVDRLLDRVPAELRDKVTVQVGSTKVKRPGQDAKMKPNQEQAIANAVDNPSLIQGSVKILGEDNETLMQIAGGEFVTDNINFAQTQTQEIDNPVLNGPAVDAPTVSGPVIETPTVNSTKPALSSGSEVAKLTETIERLQARVASLEAKVERKPISLGNNIVSNWINSQRDKLAQVVRDNVDKVQVRGHMIADKIAATTQTVKESAEDLKNTVSTTVEDYKETVVTAVVDLKQGVVDAVETISDGVELARDVAVQGTQQIINDGMARHYEAVDSLAGKINQSAHNIADGSRAIVDDPRQVFFEKALQPVAERMFIAAEKAGKIQIDPDGNKLVEVGPYTYSKEQSGRIVMRENGEPITPKNVTQKEVLAVNELKVAFPAPKVKETIEPPKLVTPKQKISV